MSKRNRKKVSRRSTPEVTSEIPTGNFWTLPVGPMEFISVADNLPMSMLIIKNLGPAIVGVYAGYGDQLDLKPGQLRVTSAYVRITVESKEDKSALIEMEVLPTS